MTQCRSPVLFGAVLLLAWVPKIGAQHRVPEVRIKVKTPCEIHPETALQTAELWMSAREALESARDTGLTAPLLLIQKWRRTLSSNLLEVRWERRDTSRVTTRQPFGRPLPANLERAGYVQERFGTITYYGPDADELLSERFLRTHCFSRVIGSGGSTGMLGLGFDPLPTQDRPDVSGVLWIDPIGGALRYVEYHWTNAPASARGPHVAGRTDFVRLADGSWVVQRWNIRMSRPGIGLSDPSDGYTDQGGEVLAVGPVP